MSILIFTETVNGKIKKASQEAIFYGAQIAKQLNTTTNVLTIGQADNNELITLGQVGATQVLHLVEPRLKTLDSKAYSKIISVAIEQTQAHTIIFATDLASKDIAARIAAKHNASLVSGAITLPVINGTNYTIKKPVFSGKAFINYELVSDKKVICIVTNTFPITKSDGSASVVTITSPLIDSDFTVKVKETKKNNMDNIPLPEAELVVSAGRGLKGPENWGIVEDLAKALGAATACSRPVSDIGWRPHHEHVGQTGLAVRPNLYIAAGISGAIQHLAGVNQSKTIVVINTDKEAPFFKAADYGIIGDAFEVLPKFTEAVKKFKASNH